jgi:phosphoesterase RecJ-like protein
MVIKLALDNKITISNPAAKALYTGLVTDSGRFLYSNVKDTTFHYVSKLLEANINIQEIYNYIYTEDEVAVRFKGYCQQNFIRTPEGLAYNKITKEILNQFHVSANFGAGIVNVLGNMKGVHIHAHFSDREEGRIKVELRSKEIPVNEVAAKYGGGGHKLASGAIVDSWEIVDKMIQDLDELCRIKNHEVV